MGESVRAWVRKRKWRSCSNTKLPLQEGRSSYTFLWIIPRFRYIVILPSNPRDSREDHGWKLVEKLKLDSWGKVHRWLSNRWPIVLCVGSFRGEETTGQWWRDWEEKASFNIIPRLCQRAGEKRNPGGRGELDSWWFEWEKEVNSQERKKEREREVSWIVVTLFENFGSSIKFWMALSCHWIWWPH